MKTYGTSSAYGAKASTPPALANYGAKGKGLPAKAGTADGPNEGLDAIVEQVLALGQSMHGLLGKMPAGKGAYGLPNTGTYNAASAPAAKGSKSGTIPYGEGLIMMYFGQQGGSNYMIVAQYMPSTGEYKKRPSKYDVQ